MGPRAEALLALCTWKYHTSQDAAAQFFHDALPIDLRPASVCSAEAFVSEALEKPVEEAYAYVQQQPPSLLPLETRAKTLRA